MNVKGVISVLLGNRFAKNPNRFHKNSYHPHLPGHCTEKQEVPPPKTPLVKAQVDVAKVAVLTETSQ